MSGCMNGCGHHSVGHIGILGVDKGGEEWYQITLGGSASGLDAAIGQVIGPSVAHADVAETLDRILNVYIAEREEGEQFIDTFRRIGVAPFKARVYAPSHQAA
jgi:sulfite reductase (NADPH) hemoprotein beta-component